MNQNFFFSTNLQKWNLFKQVNDKAILAHVVGAGQTGFYLTEEEKFFSIGSNTDGCLGINNSSTTERNYPTEITSLKGKKIIKINSLVSKDYCAGFLLTECGKMYFWGAEPKYKAVQYYPKDCDLRGTCEDIEISGNFVFIKNKTSPSHWYCINWQTDNKKILVFPDINQKPMSLAAGFPFIVIKDSYNKISLWKSEKDQSIPVKVKSFETYGVEKIAAGNWYAAALLKSGSIEIYLKNHSKENGHMEVISVRKIKFTEIIAERNSEMLACLSEGSTYFYDVGRQSLKLVNCISPIEVFASEQTMPSIFRDSGINFGHSTSRPENCDFTAFLNCKETSDIKFVFLNSQELYGHKMILKKFSPHFKQMLSGDWASDEIEIPWTLKVFNNYLKFVYCGKIDQLNHVELTELWQIADSYFEAELKSIIEKLLLDPQKLPVVPDCLCPTCIFKNMIK